MFYGFGRILWKRPQPFPTTSQYIIITYSGLAFALIILNLFKSIPNAIIETLIIQQTFAE